MVDEPESANHGIAFVLEEYRQLHEQRRSIMTSAHNQVSIFFATASAVGVAVGLLIRDDAELTTRLATFVSGVLLVLLAAGIGTLWRLAQFHANSVRYARGLNRIRRYMAERYPAIVPALSLPMDESYPKYTRDQGRLFRIIPVSGRSGIVVVVNAALSGTAASTVSLALDADTRVALTVGVAVAVFMWWYQRRLETQWLEAAETEHREAQQLPTAATTTAPAARPPSDAGSLPAPRGDAPGRS